MPSSTGIVASGYYAVVAGDTFIMGYRQDVLGWSSADAVSGMTFTRTQASGNLGGGSAGQNGAADAEDGDYWDVFVNLASGTYTFTLIHLKGTALGVCELLLDGTSLGTIDCYNASNTDDNVSAITGVAVAADGNYTLRIKVNGKHASSSDYLLGVQAVTMTRTGA